MVTAEDVFEGTTQKSTRQVTQLLSRRETWRDGPIAMALVIERKRLVPDWTWTQAGEESLGQWQTSGSGGELPIRQVTLEKEWYQVSLICSLYRKCRVLFYQKA